MFYLASFFRNDFSPKPFLLPMSLAFFSMHVSAMSLDGKGHFGVKGSVEASPMGGQVSGKAQGIEESVYLEGELRFNDRSSFFLNLNLFDRQHYLGDKFSGRYCSSESSETAAGEINMCHPNVREPSYVPYTLRAEQAHVQYAFDYFILDAGRRGRNWGMGLFLDDGAKPFAKAASLYDGLTFSVNRQKSQTLGFAVGIDKVAEHGATPNPAFTQKNDIYNDNDDLEQLFMLLEYDDSLGTGAGLDKKIGIYASRFFPSASIDKGGSDTNLGILDLYLDLQYGGLLFQNEILISYGSSADPNGKYLGGGLYTRDGAVSRNDYSSVGLAARLEWAFAHSGAIVGPKNFGQGDLIRHVMYADYAYAPGNSDGYYNFAADSKTVPDGKTAAQADEVNEALGLEKRGASAKAVAFHPNFAPTLILFNQGSELSDYAVDGIYDPNRIMNAQVISIGYRYENLQVGTFKTQLSYATLLESMPDSVSAYYNSADVKAYRSNNKIAMPVGTYGNELGYELDLGYAMRVNQDVDWGIALGALFPGKALKVFDKDLEYNYLIQTDMVFKF